ncbi:MAG: HAD-IB family phosphatase [Acidimicrobiia bacterium]
MDLDRCSVFFDFDGTISIDDTGVYLLERLGAPEWRELDAQYARGEIGSRQCVGAQWDLLPHDEALVRATAAEVAIDPHFAPLVHALWDAGAEVAVVSDGFGFNVRALCDQLGVDCYANDVDWAAWKLLHPFEDRCCACSSCGTCKQAPIKDAKRRGRTTVLVGDGVSDRKAALLADLVFAKDGLARWCDDMGAPYRPFTTLAEVYAGLFAPNSNSGSGENSALID